MIGISAMLDPLLPTVVATAALAIQTAVPVKSRVSFCEASAAWPRSFAEEFDGPDLNSSRWSKYLHNSAGQCGFGIGRFGRCDADNVYIEDGKLVLKSDKLPAQQCTAKEGCFNYTSAGVTSRDKATWSVAGGAGYRVCVSAMLPGGTSADDGAGIWPAHWMMPNDSNSEQGTQACTGPRKNGGCSCDPDEGEIDILEMVDGNAQA
jgi:beta-glucanase (GH16 family)